MTVEGSVTVEPVGESRGDQVSGGLQCARGDLRTNVASRLGDETKPGQIMSVIG